MYHKALRELTDDERALVEGALNDWSNGSCPKWQRIVINIKSETALPVSEFTDLLAAFCGALSVGASSPEDCWISVCRNHQFKGQRMPDPIPDCLGRATSIGDYAATICDSPGINLSQDECAEMIRDIALSGGMPDRRDKRRLRKAMIGRYVIWATFCKDNPSENPFDHLPSKSTHAVRTAMGLGECSETETLVLLAYASIDAPSGDLLLHRPTIAEAEKYSWYRPSPDMNSPHGWTEPLPPNEDGYPPQPEVVHREITGETLDFPLYLTF